MKIITYLLCIISGIFFLSTTTAFAGHYGVTIPVIIVDKDPENTHAIRGVVWYQPQMLTWEHVNVRIAAGAGHWWVTGSSTPNRTINIFAVAPVVRLYLANTKHFSPYFEASVGPAYMTQTRLDDQNLGIHYTFQDEVTIGALFGKDHGFYAAISALHYSNCTMSAHNAGITVPVILNLGYQFA